MGIKRKYGREYYWISLLYLPNEILCYIIEYINLIDIIRLRRCCSRLRNIIDIDKYIALSTSKKIYEKMQFTCIQLYASKIIMHGELISNIGNKSAHNYSYGKLHGPSINCDEEGNIKTISNYKHGILDGVYNECQRNKYTKYTYVKGIKHGPYKIYINSICRYSGFYLYGLKHGTYIRYDGYCRHTIANHTNTDSSRIVFHYGTEILHKDIQYNNGVYHVKKYDITGYIYCEYSYRYNNNNCKTIIGTKYTYFKSGEKASMRNYMDGIEHGLSEAYWDTGHIMYSANYWFGLYHCIYLYYHYNSKQVKEEISYYLGKKHGICSYYNDDGHKYMEKIYEYDRLIKVIEYKM